MKKRKLPSAIRRTGDDEAAADTQPTVQHEAPVIPTKTGKSRAEPSAAARPVETVDAERSAENDLKVPALVVTEPLSPEAKQRRSQANSIVERYAAFSAAGGAIPLPIANLASLTALIVQMVKRLSKHYGVPYERQRTRTMVIALLGGILPSGFGIIAGSTLGLIIPASAILGLAVSSVSAFICTRQIGRAFMDHFESGKTLDEYPLIQLR